MGILLLSFITVCLFSFSARRLTLSIVSPIRWVDNMDLYSKRALRIERRYKIFAWGVLTLMLFSSMLASFIEAFSVL